MHFTSTLAFSAALFAAPAWSWGVEGHKTVATIAQIHLLPSARRAIRDILPDKYNGSLAGIATWPDEVRNETQWKWSKELHFVNGKNDKPPKNCLFGEQGWESDMNVLNGIVNMTRIITNSTGEQQDFALRFLTHFLGDVHQPLHLTGHYWGANNVPVLYEGNHRRLHSVWDDDLIEYRIRTLTNYTTALPTSPAPSLSPSTLLRNKHIESALTGSNYDPLVRWIVLEGIYGWWAGELNEWTTCPQLDVQRQGEGQKTMQNLPYEDPLDVPVCPYHWSAPSHQMVCDFIWRSDFEGVKNWTEAVFQIELEPEYGSLIRDKKTIEKQLALGGMRLAATLNTVLGSEEEMTMFGAMPRVF
ncbi:hypothetical protein FRC12_011103 [Ceratobasidium sp. 428]|nr:hypothetical protein FRC12_011103 [Ceratobasidium sp. 428]